MYSIDFNNDNAKKNISYSKVPSGFYFGEKTGFINGFLGLLGADRSVVKESKEDGQIAIIGGSGSGKTSTVIAQTLCRTWHDPFVAIDIKGELKAICDTLNPDKKVKVFSLRGETPYTIDPFEHLRHDEPENLVSNVRELVNALLPKPLNPNDPVWIDSARELLTAGILHYYDLGTVFTDAIIAIMTTPPCKLIDEIGRGNNSEAKVSINNFLGDDVISDSKFLIGISQEITNRLSIIATDPRVRDALVPSENQIRWTDLEHTSIFLSVPEDRLEQYSPVLTMMITQLIRTLERRPEKHSPEGANCRPVLLLFDEFPRLGQMEVITSAVSTLRSRNATMCLVFQSLAQLDAIYGRYVRRIILDNCSYIAVLKINDVESQKYFSDLAGMKRVSNYCRSSSYDPDGKETGYSIQTTYSYEPAIRSEEFGKLKDVILFTPDGFIRVKKVPYYEPTVVQKVTAVVTGFFNRIRRFWGRRRAFC